MRLTLAVLVIVLLPALSPAQSRVRLPRVSASLPSIGLPLPRIALPLAPLGLPPAIDRRDAAVVHQRPATHLSRQRAGGTRGFRSGPAVVYFVPTYLWSYGHLAQSATATPTYRDQPARPLPADYATGTLRLAVEPSASVQIFVDGFFVGTPFDFGGALEIEAGPHRIELRAPGYQTLSFDVRIVPGRSVTYQGALDPLAAPPAPVAPVAPAVPAEPALPAPVARSTVYLIPGCYLGNIPPEDAGLPATCDQTQVTTFEP